MSKELVISANRHETRVAVLEDDQVVEVFYQRENEYSLAGSIQSAFVDIGLGRDAFLYVSDFFEDNDEYDKIVTSVEEKVLKLDRTPAPEVAGEQREHHRRIGHVKDGVRGIAGVGETAENQVHLADAAMPRAEQQLAPAWVQPFT